ncbi:uncharacterized protein METZ01_LOCUS313467, partial [marine metagenome]
VESDLKVGVGAWLGSSGPTTDAITEQATKAEALGFHSFWLPESHFSSENSVPAPLLLLAVAAAQTKTLFLGTSSFLLPIRNPIQMAEEISVLDQLSSGRVILGVGRGYQRQLFSAYGTQANNKRQVFEEALRKMISAWAGEPIEVEGKETDENMNSSYLFPLPFQRPHPPIWVAAFGSKAVSQAGRLGFPYLASPVETLSMLEAKYARHREAQEKYNHGVAKSVPVMRTIFVSRKTDQLNSIREKLDAETRLRADSPVIAIRTSADASIEDWAIIGEPAEVADKIELYRERLGVTHLIATRTRLSHLTSSELEGSLELLAEIVN